MAPRDLIKLGAVRGAYGLKGWVRIAPFAADGGVLEAVRHWWLLGAASQSLTLQEVRRHATSILAKWEGCESKEAADALKGRTIAIARSDFPALSEGEHYLSDVVGYRVVNREGSGLGTVSGIRSGAAAQWLELEACEKGESLLIPLIEQYVDAIDSDARTVRVDWKSDW
ncbi:MAG TPA: ribosome maturation factor RimM [Burkholderiaceae bacterium]|nr:ribosome maturation factor RimM [Burkholderiaceae bacterium]